MQANEASEFPILCETCLGPNPYVRMTRKPNGKECKLCLRGFTVFSWCPGGAALQETDGLDPSGGGGSGKKYKQTLICQTCARVKNVCQSCILDLEYKLSSQVRDTVLAQDGHIANPKLAVNRDYHIATQAKLADGPLGEALLGGPMSMGGRQDSAAKHILRTMSRQTPYGAGDARGIKLRPCSFFQKGLCTRGSSCPFRHDLDVTAAKAPSAAISGPGPVNSVLTPPEDQDITTLYVSGVDSFMKQEDIRNAFEPFGALRSIVILSKSGCAFVSFDTRPCAEAAANALSGKLVIRGTTLGLAWGRPRRARPGEHNVNYGAHMNISGQPSAPISMDQLLALGDSATVLPPPPVSSTDAVALVGTGKKANVPLYPSQNPRILGSNTRDFRSI